VSTKKRCICCDRLRPPQALQRVKSGAWAGEMICRSERAPWLDAERVAAALEAYDFNGVRFEATTFVPTAPSDGKYDGQEIPAVRLAAASTAYDAPRIAVAMLVEIRRAHPAEWGWLGTFDRLAGTAELRRGIDAGLGMDVLTADWDAALAAFGALRAPYLIYRD
jgi:uncharacterized protein YbbC (DUF1343 family)